MRDIFSPEGDQALRQALKENALFAFDYDGTLAPITAQYAHTSTPREIIQSLEQLAQLGKVVIITGRSISDVSSRLGFTPHAIIGNHGAESLSAADTGQYAKLVAGWRAVIDANFAESLNEAGIVMEDKGCSLSLHYRQAHDTVSARQLILHACSLLSPPARIFGGKCVVNIAPHDAPDKADALLAMARSEKALTAIFVGDDQNDEVVFRRAPERWLTVRVGRNRQSTARYYLEQQTEMAQFIDTILRHLKNR